MGGKPGLVRFEDVGLIRADRFHEVSFEELERDPIGQMRGIYQALGLPDFGEVDIGQHIWLRCCTALEGLLHDLGVPDDWVYRQDRVAMPYRRPDGSVFHLAAGRLPGLLSFLPSLLRMPGLAVGDKLAEAVSLTGVGMGLLLTGAYPASIENYQRALSLFRDLGSAFDEADALTELGFAWRLTGDYAAALAHEREALELWRQLGDRLGQAWALGDLGMVHQETGEYSAAAACLEEALELHRDLGSRHGEIVALNNLGELATRTSAPGKASEIHREALAKAIQFGAPAEQARALAGLGRSQLACDKLEAARNLREALAIYQRIGTPEARLIQDTLDEHGL